MERLPGEVILAHLSQEKQHAGACALKTVRGILDAGETGGDTQIYVDLAG